VSAEVFNKESEYITVFTDKGTAKRVKLSEMEKSSRARKGLLLIRLIKTNPHKILSAHITNTKDLIGMLNIKGITILKNSEITIADRYSTGSTISKVRVVSTFNVKELENKDDIKEVEVKEEVKKEVSLKEIDEEILTIDDFLDDFKIE
jgi:DNA gyrase/topoisomerase IV subunit A